MVIILITKEKGLQKKINVLKKKKLKIMKRVNEIKKQEIYNQYYNIPVISTQQPHKLM